MGNQNDRDFLSFFFLLLFFFSGSSAKGRKTKVKKKKKKKMAQCIKLVFKRQLFFNQLSRPRRDSSQDAVAVVTGMIKAPRPRHAHRQLLMAGKWEWGGGVWGFGGREKKQ